MFSQLAVGLLALSALSSTLSKPIWSRRNAARDTSPNTPQAFNGWHGISSLDHFDDFNGVQNFDGSRNEQVIIVQEQQVVCHTQVIEIIQQRLVVLQEMAKRIITEQICEVETQTIVLEQFSSSVGSFGHDISRQSGKHVGYDKNIASLLKQLLNDDGSLNVGNLGFSGSDVGKNTVSPSGNNWNNTDGPSRVSAAKQAAQKAKNYNKPNGSSSSAAASTSASGSSTASSAASSTAASSVASQSASASVSSISEAASVTASSKVDATSSASA